MPWPCRGFRFNESDQVLFKKKYVACLALGIMKVKCFPSSPSRVCEITEKELYALGLFWQIRYLLHFNDKNHV